ncbi:uncharacterized protein LOC142343865 [Convolutriloba macropyga]|uniref:uncharacterized protein LOC142343865 n=1 Tax=Convolutriloba macropyga TaxID=536237 RepID=UPI003F523A7C
MAEMEDAGLGVLIAACVLVVLVVLLFLCCLFMCSIKKKNNPSSVGSTDGSNSNNNGSTGQQEGDGASWSAPDAEYTENRTSMLRAQMAAEREATENEQQLN